MPNATQNNLGSVVSLWRYPVKSMMGEELNATDVTHRGLLGDRAYALVDSSNEKVASAKNPRKWAKLFDFRAALANPPRTGEKISAVHVALPDGTIVTSEQTDINQILSNVLGHEVTLETREPSQPEIVETTLPNPWTPSQYEEYWPDMEDLAYRDTVTHEAMPEGTFFDLAVIHILTTATIDQLRELYPQGRFEVRRFRPNIVVEPSSGEEGFVEDDWVGKTLVIGDEVRIDITELCPRCVMTTLPQGDLPKDPGILRTAAQHNQVNVGVYGAVLQGGTIRRGDQVRVE
jgi:uncharacterized protein YcbX